MVKCSLPDLPRVNNSSCSLNVMHAKAWITFCGREILLSGTNQADILPSNIIESWFKTTSQFRHRCVQRSTIFCDAKYNILRRLSSFVNDGLFSQSVYTGGSNLLWCSLYILFYEPREDMRKMWIIYPSFPPNSLHMTDISYSNYPWT